VRGEISGQINRAVLWADNGTDSDVGHVDNSNSGTRFRITGSADVTENTQAGVAWETQFESNASAAFDIDQNNDGSADFKERKLEAWYRGAWGKLSIGQGDGAANGTSEMDLSGTTVVAYSGIADMAGGITFKTLRWRRYRRGRGGWRRVQQL
jgi:predicted porin